VSDSIAEHYSEQSIGERDVICPPISEYCGSDFLKGAIDEMFIGCPVRFINVLLYWYGNSKKVIDRTDNKTHDDIDNADDSIIIYNFRNYFNKL